MSPNAVGIIGIIILIFLLFARMEIGFAMAFVGFLGFAYLGGLNAAFGILATVPYRSLADYTVSVVPLFIFMGLIVSSTGISKDLYRTSYKWVGHMPGGLAIATIGACAAFAAICGESMAEAATMGKVAVPEMKKYNYGTKLATGCVAAGGTLGILIPPSLGFILYAIITQQSVGLLFMAGILPGILLTLLFIVAVVVITKRNPQLGPAGPKVGLSEKIRSLKQTWGMFSLFVFIMGGIYVGIFTPTEAGALGAFGAIVITLVSRQLNWIVFKYCLRETGQIASMIAALIVGAFIFVRFLAISKLPFALAGFVAGLDLNPYMILLLIVFIYLLLGMFLDILSAIILTVPVIYPTIIAMGFDPIWFGVVMVLVMELGLITPPVGMNVFVIAGVTNTPPSTVFLGVIPFVLAIIACIVIVTVFPQIATFIPNLVR